MEENQNIIVDGRPSTVMAVLDQFSTSAEGIEKFAQLVISEVEEGRVDPLQVALFMKTMEKITEKVNERVREHYLREAEKHGAKVFAFNGAVIELADVGVKYDYAKCGHPAWNKLTEIINHATEQRKNIEAELRLVHGSKTILDEGTGEVATVSQPVRSGRAGIKISIK